MWHQTLQWAVLKCRSPASRLLVTPSNKSVYSDGWWSSVCRHVEKMLCPVQRQVPKEDNVKNEWSQYILTAFPRSTAPTTQCVLIILVMPGWQVSLVEWAHIRTLDLTESGTNSRLGGPVPGSGCSPCTWRTADSIVSNCAWKSHFSALTQKCILQNVLEILLHVKLVVRQEKM